MLTNNTPPQLRTVDLDLLELSKFHQGLKLPTPSPPEVERARQHEILDSIVCRPSGLQTGRFEILRHLKTWRIAQEAQLSSVPVLVYSVTDNTAAELVESDKANWTDEQRAIIIDPITEAEELMAALKADTGPSHGKQSRLARKLNVSRAYICQKLRLLHLCAEVKNHGRQNKLGDGHLRALTMLEKPEDQKQLAARAIEDKWSTELVFRRAILLKNDRKKEAYAETVDHKKTKDYSADYLRLENAIKERFRCRAKLSKRHVTLYIGRDIPVLQGVLEKLGEASNVPGIHVTYDGERLLIDFDSLDAVDVFLARIGLAET